MHGKGADKAAANAAVTNAVDYASRYRLAVFHIFFRALALKRLPVLLLMPTCSCRRRQRWLGFRSTPRAMHFHRLAVFARQFIASFTFCCELLMFHYYSVFTSFSLFEGFFSTSFHPPFLSLSRGLHSAGEMLLRKFYFVFILHFFCILVSIFCFSYTFSLLVVFFLPLLYYYCSPFHIFKSIS